MKPIKTITSHASYGLPLIRMILENHGMTADIS